MNDELGEGSVDGTWKRLYPNRSAIDFPSHRPERMEIGWPFDFQEAPTPINPTTGLPARKAKGARPT